jgi:Phage integrase family.
VVISVGGWDKGLDYDSFIKVLLRARQEAREHRTRRSRKALRNINIMLIQLTNGLRVSEAIECYNRFLETGEREIPVRVAKSKNRFRMCLIPSFIDSLDVELTRDLKPISVTSLGCYAIRKFKTNTHSLRYAFINKMLKEGLDPATVAKIVGHRKLDTILTYIQEKRAKEELEKHIKMIAQLGV